MDFVVRAWSAFVPGHCWHQHWPGSPVAQALVAGSPQLPAAVSKAMLRRLSPLARDVIGAMHVCLRDSKPLPVIFSTSHGEVNKSLTMLKDSQNGEEVSPTAFSLSVHNAISGLFSIVSENHQEINVIAPGRDAIAPAFIDALGLLQELPSDQPNEALIVFYDEPLADFYPALPFALSAPSRCVLVIKIALHGDGSAMQLSRSAELRDDGEHALQIFAFLDFLKADTEFIRLGNQRQSWLWRKS